MGYIYTLISISFGLFFVAMVVNATAVNPVVFLDVPSFILVFGATFIATAISYPPSRIVQAFKAAGGALKDGRQRIQDSVKAYADAMASLKKGAVRDVESHIRAIHSPYLETAAQMVIDGSSIDDIVKILNWRLERVKTFEKNNAAVFKTMAGYAPAFGMVGTLVGLVNMMGTMKSGNFDHIGMNMALALITTFYGLVLANLVFKPVAVKIEQRLHDEVILLSIAKESAMLLFQGKSTAYTKDILEKYLERTRDELAG